MMTEQQIIDLINANKALGSDPTRVEITDLAKVLKALQDDILESGGTGLVVQGAPSPGKVPKFNGTVTVWGDDLTGNAGSVGTLDQVLGNGNTTDEGIVFDTTLPKPPEADAVAKRWFRFDNLVKTSGEGVYDRVPFNWWHSAFTQFGEVNEVMKLGWNFNAGGGPDVAGLPGIGISMESNFSQGERLVELHDFYITPQGQQIRLRSYTVRTATQAIDYYKTVSRFSLDLPFLDKRYLSATASATSAIFALGNDIVGLKNFYIEYNQAAGGGVFVGATGLTEQRLISQNLTSWDLPGITMASANGDTNIFIKGTAGCVIDLQTDNLCDLGVPARRFRTAHIKQYQLQSKAGVPNVSDVTPNSWSVWKNTSNGETRLYINDAGTLKSILIS